MGAQRVDGARVLVEDDLLVGERRAREVEARRRGSLDALVAGVGGDEHEQPLQAELALRSLRQLDVAVVRGIEGAAEETDHGASSKVSSPTSISAPVRAPAARSARSSSSSLGGVPTTRNPVSVRKSRHVRARGSGR